MTPPGFWYPHSLRSLLLGGDWACASCDAEQLVQVVELLGRCVATDDQARLAAIARTARLDMQSARREWQEIAARVRHQLLEESAMPVARQP